MLLPPDQIMHPHVSREDLVALAVGFLLGLAALVGGLQNLVGVVRGKTENKDGVPKYDTGTALIGILVGSLFIWITMIYGLPEKRAESLLAQKEELKQHLISSPGTMPVDTFLAYVRVGALGLDGDTEREPGLIQYAEAGDATAVGRLLDAGAPVDAHQTDERTALLVAVDNDDLAMVRLLLAAHANANLDAGNLPIFDAVDPEGQDHPANADPGDTEDAPIKRDGHDYTADRQEIVTALAQAGADLNARDERGYTPLMIAAASGQCDLVAALVLAGADQSLQATTGETALAWARDQNHPECVPMLAAGGRGRTASATLVASTALEHPPRLSGDKHLEGTQSNFERRLAAQKAEAEEVEKKGDPGWFIRNFGNNLLSILLTLIVSTLSYFLHRVWRFLRGDHRPVRWAWIPIGVSSSSSGGESGSGGTEDRIARGGGRTGGGGAERDY